MARVIFEISEIWSIPELACTMMHRGLIWYGAINATIGVC